MYINSNYSNEKELKLLQLISANIYIVHCFAVIYLTTLTPSLPVAPATKTVWSSLRTGRALNSAVPVEGPLNYFAGPRTSTVPSFTNCVPVHK